jgi:hypothetical protein
MGGTAETCICINKGFIILFAKIVDALNRYFCIKGVRKVILARGGIISTRPEGPRDYKKPKSQNRRSRPKCKHYFL